MNEEIDPSGLDDEDEMAGFWDGVPEFADELQAGSEVRAELEAERRIDDGQRFA